MNPEMQEVTDDSVTDPLIPVNKWNEHYEWPPQGGLRHLIFHKKTNGFSTAFKKVGRRVLVDPKEFWACAKRQSK